MTTLATIDRLARAERRAESKLNATLAYVNALVEANFWTEERAGEQVRLAKETYREAKRALAVAQEARRAQ